MASAMQELRDTIARLRGPGGCPWDQEQDHQSLADCLMEECCELLDTIDRLDMEHMREELGDVLLQVVFHAQLAEEAGLFDLEQVAADVNEKLVRRHPHVFGDLQLQTSEQVLQRWEELKAEERKGKPDPAPANVGFKHLPPQLPALLYARDVFKEIEKRQLPIPETVDLDAVETFSEGLDEAEAGRLLFAMAAACRRNNVDPESALRRYASAIVRGYETRQTEATPRDSSTNETSGTAASSR